VDPAAAERLLLRALDLGVNFIDTARAYGEAEAIIGRALGARRRDFVLCSKVQWSADEAKVVESVHESLRQLRTGEVDIMMIHSSPAVDTGAQLGIAGVLDNLRQQGKIRFLGASVYGERTALDAIADGRFDCLQIAYSALDRRPEWRIAAAAKANDVGIVARSVLLKGALTHRAKFLPPGLEPIREAVSGLEPLTESLPELAYRYVLGTGAVQSALVGTAHPAELEAVIGYAARGPLPAETVSRIRSLPMPPAPLLNPGNWPALQPQS
jgi:aryl-alcohol dehydrogenase-like predicted oxidoreductase